MKKFFLGLMACAALSACTKDDAGSGSGIAGGSDQLDGNVAYLTVKISDVGSSTTRATDGGYANASATEYAVANAYFYFYDDNGNYVAKGRASSIGGSATEYDPATSIEFEGSTIVAVWGVSQGSLPTRMVTVLNQPSGFDGTNLSFAEMEAALANATYECQDGSGNFVMSTSSYYDGSNSGIINYTALTANDFRTEPVDLTNDYDSYNKAVDVYVERLAAKVVVAVNSTLLDGAGGSARTRNGNAGTNRYVYSFSDVVEREFAVAPSVSSGNTLSLEILGWEVNGVARNSNMVKNISNAANWGSTLGWSEYNSATDHRSFWGESYNYGIGGYPTSSNGNTDAGEETDPLNTYLKYTSLNSAKDFGGYAYCAENTNSLAVLESDDNARTSILIKAQFGEANNNSGVFTGIDLIKYHGEYLTFEDFKNDMVAEVMEYDIKTISQEVCDALATAYPTFSSIIADLGAAMDPTVYIMKTSGGTEYEVFDGRFINLISQYDGYVSMWFNTTTAVYTDGTTPTGNIPAAYDGSTSKIVYRATESLDDYTPYFKVDLSELSSAEIALLTGAGIMTADGYIALNDNLTLTTENGHIYSFRNYLIRAIEKEAAAIDDDWAESGYPIFYNQGLMYYSAPIEHLGAEGYEGQYGVVRNHWYDYTLDYISDFGHGIADPDEVIVPSPERDYYYLGATVNILSWKTVTGSLGF